jgi:hypothetical protein
VTGTLGGMPKIECVRCGFEWVVANVRKQDNYCVSCRARKVATVDLGGDKCHPWQGMFGSDLITPVDDNGRPVKPGHRVCGNADCVNSRHIEEE